MGEIIFREPVVNDAENIVSFYNRVGGETTFLSFEKDEYPLSVEEQKASIESTAASPNNLMLLVLDGEDIVGIGTISSSWKIKSRHSGELGIVVEQAHQGQGIGTEIIKRLIEWCKENGYTTRIQLDTRCDNEKAVELYQKFGFEIEGRIKNSTLLDGTYYDLYIMGMMVK